MNGSKMIFSGSLFSYLGGTASEKAIRTYSSEWISGNLAYLEHGGVKMIPWKDDPKRPFFMESLPEDIYQAFILKAASAVAGMPMLDRIPHGFRSRRHPLVLKLMSSGDMIWEKTLFSVLFVPSPDMFTYRSSLPDIGDFIECYLEVPRSRAEQLARELGQMLTEGLGVSVEKLNLSVSG